MLVPEEWHTIREKRKKGMLRHYSPRDVIEHLERICRLEIGDEWKFSEIPKKIEEDDGRTGTTNCLKLKE